MTHIKPPKTKLLQLSVKITKIILLCLPIFLATYDLRASGKKIGTLTIGFIAPQTGSLKEWGKDAITGAEIALDHIKKTHPQLFPHIKLIVEDDGSTPKGAEKAALKLIEQRATILVGSITQSGSVKVGEVAKKHHRPHLIPASSSFGENQQLKGTILGFYTSPWQGNLMSHFASQHLKLKHVAILLNPQDSYAYNIADFFQSSFTKRGGEVSSRQIYSAPQELEESLKILLKQKPQGIFFPTKSIEESKLVVKALDKLGVKIPLLGTSTWHSPKLTNFRTLEQTKINQYYPVNFYPSSPIGSIKDFVEEFESKTRRTPSSLASMTYDSLMMIVDAFKRAESNRPKLLTQELLKTKEAPGLFGTTALSSRRSAEKPALILELGQRGKRYVAISNPRSGKS